MVPLDPKTNRSEEGAPKSTPLGPVETCECFQGVEDSLIRFIEKP